MADTVVDVEIAPGHRITGTTDGTITRELVNDGEMRLQPVQQCSYSCSCGALDGVSLVLAESHAENVTP